MSLTGVKVSEEVWLTCLTHALSTETEEIMGLLLGDIEYSKNGSSVTAIIWGASPQSRSDRRKDRVETNPEQLAAASAQAEISFLLPCLFLYAFYYTVLVTAITCLMTVSTGRTTRVIGWYHSHPHITVLPSHVDVRTQAMYQLLDPGFIGLIFSCFNEDVNKVGRIQVIAFQSSDGKQSNTIRPVSLPSVNKSYIDVESSLSSSENLSVKSGSARLDSPEPDTADSRTAARSSKGGGRSLELGDFFATADANYVGRERTGGGYTGNSDSKVVDLDPMDMTESMQEAMHRSNLDMSGAEYNRKEIPLHVLPTWVLLKLDSPLTSFTDLQRVLYEEERGAYNQAVLQNLRDGKVHPLTFIHHTATYQASMCKLIEYCLSPAINALQDRLTENDIRLAMLIDEAKILESEGLKASEPASRSPRHAPAYVSRGSPSSVPRDRELHSSYDSLGVRSVPSSGPSGSRSRIGS
ncbi:Lys-63-specific deubiquitinase BRCC36 [Euphorbia peplus]|nr:Lys-63-specific deubiquitinase BRCC36 [Euphorbia peplus]